MENGGEPCDCADAQLVPADAGLDCADAQLVPADAGLDCADAQLDSPNGELEGESVDDTNFGSHANPQYRFAFRSNEILSYSFGFTRLAREKF